MKRFKHILFIPCSAGANRLALRQALQLTRENEARLTVFIAPRHVPEEWELASVVERHLREMAGEDLMAVVSDIGMEFTPDDVPVHFVQGEPFLEIIRAVLQDGYDLVIKAAELEGEGREQGFNTTDMHLLRKCPCPLWLFRPHKNPENGLRLLAAIDPAPANPANPALTRTLLELGTSLRDRLPGAKLDVLYAWQYEYEDALRNSPFIRMPKEEVDAKVSAARIRRAEEFEAALTGFAEGTAVLNRRLEKGSPIDVVPQAVQDTPIDLLIMGTLARSGIAGLLIGNTAESILKRVDCSVIAIKPDGFKSPVSL